MTSTFCHILFKVKLTTALSPPHSQSHIPHNSQHTLVRYSPSANQETLQDSIDQLFKKIKHSFSGYIFRPKYEKSLSIFT